MADDVNESLAPLLDLQINQSERRSRIYTQTELDEVRAISRLAYELFGTRGVVEQGPAEPGIFYVGQYDRVYGPETPTQNRRRCLLLRGASHAELVAQAAVLLRRFG